MEAAVGDTGRHRDGDGQHIAFVQVVVVSAECTKADARHRWRHSVLPRLAMSVEALRKRRE